MAADAAVKAPKSNALSAPTCNRGGFLCVFAPINNVLRGDKDVGRSQQGGRRSAL